VANRDFCVEVVKFIHQIGKETIAIFKTLLCSELVACGAFFFLYNNNNIYSIP